MVYVPATPSGAIVQALGKMTSRDFSAARLIGGKLRALYNETEQPTPAHLNELLRTLDERSGRAADNSGHDPGIGTFPARCRGPGWIGPHKRAFFLRCWGKR